MPVKILTPAEALRLLHEAEGCNPGPWVQHSLHVAQAAGRIAAAHPALDPDRAYVMGLLHDIGRRAGVTDMRHVIDGFRHLSELGYADAARACMTHSFPVKNALAGAGQWDCSPEEFEFVQRYLDEIEYSAYDRLIQLCDCLASPAGFCLIEKRLVDVALRHGVNAFTLEKWSAFFTIRDEFEQAVGGSIYLLLPGVVENTFGADPMPNACPV